MTPTPRRETIDDAALARFIEAARSYCAFIEGDNDVALDKRAVTARLRLAEVYAAQLRLPSISGLRADVQERPVGAPVDWKGFGASELYYEIHDPFKNEGTVGALLSEDLLDIYVSLKSGVIYWDTGRTEEALWEWTFEFNAHWGDHLVDALRALHRMSEEIAIR